MSRTCLNTTCLDNIRGCCAEEGLDEDLQTDWHLISCKNVRRE